MGACRFDSLCQDIAVLNGVVGEWPEPCREPAVFRAQVDVRQGVGMSVELHASLCRDHDNIARMTDGYVGSWRLRSRTAT